MQGRDKFKKTDAQQTKMINNFKNIKQKLLKTNAAIWFNKICGKNQLTPTCVKIKIKGNNKKIKHKNCSGNLNQESRNQEIKFR